MTDDPAERPRGNPAPPDLSHDPTIWDPEVEVLEEVECWSLIAPGGVGRLAYSGRLGLAVIPVRYKLTDDGVVFRTQLDSTTDEDLRTGIEGAEYRVSFEIDEVGPETGEGWVVLIQGDAHHMDSDDDRASAWATTGQASGHSKEHFLRITPTSIDGRRVRGSGA
jgi:hypothetical protein